MPVTPLPDQVPPAGVALRITNVSVKHTLCGTAVKVILYIGLTVMVKLTGIPVQLTLPLVKVGVTVMVAVTGIVPLLIAVKAGTMPVPEAASPIPVLLFAQLYTVPATGPAMLTAAVVAPLQRTWLAITFTAGVGLTVMVNVRTGPVQVTPPLVNEAVTVMVAVTGTVVAFVAVKLAIFPVPLAARPMDMVLFVQLYVAPVVELVNVTAVVVLLHNTLLATRSTVGVGFTVIVKVTGVPEQLIPPLL